VNDTDQLQDEEETKQEEKEEVGRREEEKEVSTSEERMEGRPQRGVLQSGILFRMNRRH